VATFANQRVIGSGFDRLNHAIDEARFVVLVAERVLDVGCCLSTLAVAVHPLLDLPGTDTEIEPRVPHRNHSDSNRPPDVEYRARTGCDVLGVLD
jgi:hypothetical protein